MRFRNHRLGAVLVAGGLATVGCGTGSLGEDGGTTVPASVLIAGQVIRAGTPQATYWRDQVATTLLESGLSISIRTALIDADGRSVVAGSYSIGGSGPTFPAYWVDGLRRTINSSDQGVVRALALNPVAGDLVLGGEVDDTAGSYAAYWVGGTSTRIVGGANGASSVLGLAVDSIGVVFAGGSTPWTGIPSRSMGFAWREGDTALRTYMIGADTRVLTVEENAGVLGILVDDEPTDAEVQTGPWSGLTGSQIALGGHSVFVSGMAFGTRGDIYVSAVVQLDGTTDNVPGYFGNGVWSPLPSVSTQDNASGIDVDPQGHIYVAGTVYAGGKLRAGYWRDGTWTYLTDGSEDGSAALSIDLR